MKIKRVVVPMNEKIFWKYKNKCYFYNLSSTEVIVNLIERFVMGEFDEDFDIPEDDYFTMYHELAEKESHKKYDMNYDLQESKESEK